MSLCFEPCTTCTINALKGISKTTKYGYSAIDTVKQGNWSLSIKQRIDGFVTVAKCYQYAKVPTYSRLQNIRLLTVSIFPRSE